MYRRRDDVEKLVHAMQSGEKRYFTNFLKISQLPGQPSKYTLLFDLLERGESELPNYFNDNSPQGLTTAKKKLYDKILKALRSLNENRSVEIIIQNQLTEIEILYRLGLPDQALHILRKAYKEGRRHERFGLMLQILEWEKKLNIVLDKPSRSTQEIVGEEKKVLSMLSQIMELENIYSHAKEMKRQKGFFKGKKAIDELRKATIHAPNTPTLSACLSDKAVYYYNFIHALYYWMVFEHNKAFEYSEKLVEASLKQVLPNDYTDGIFEHITSCVCLGRFEDVLEGIELGAKYIEEQKLNQSHAFMLKMFAYKYTNRIIVFNYMGNRKKLQETIKEAEQKLKQFDHILPFEVRQVINGNLMNAYLGIGNLDKADEILESLFNRQSQTVRLDIYADLYLFRLFSLLHAKRYSLIHSVSMSATRFYRKHKDAEKQYDVELPITQLLYRCKDFEKHDCLVAVMRAAKDIVQKFISSLRGMHGFQEHYTRYVIWCDAIINDIPFHEAAAKWYAKFNPGRPKNKIKLKSSK